LVGDVYIEELAVSYVCDDFLSMNMEKMIGPYVWRIEEGLV